MRYDWTAIPGADVPVAADPMFQHIVDTYASETNKTASMWRAVPEELLDFRPHDKCNPIRAILVHQLLSERRFAGQIVRGRMPKGLSNFASSACVSLHGWRLSLGPRHSLHGASSIFNRAATSVSRW